ncbi:PKD domain-containing protein [Winogradskyella luteola]|uniref:PKD domain-containing protein n=1 Tax=Winogradskyella luteola TaxID=2828330 RepID=A0A9X1F8P4_9FLAO|nr:PKD domain-containing protein [Winogradskyella luteola]MBV7269397.1 PKD domain-containing protein [Winogradskyella luteola]
MKLLKYKITLLSIIILSCSIISCEDSDSGVSLIGLESRFLSDVQFSTITFTNASNDATSYLWDFGNGDTDVIANPTVTFDNGTYTVTLTAFDDNGNSDTFSETFTINCETSENIDPANGNLNWTFFTISDDTTFDAFGNTAGFIVENPVVDAVNPSCKVQRFEKTTGCFTFAGLGVALDTPLDFSLPETGKTFTIKVLAETQLTDVTLRLEFMPFPNTEPSQDRVASITQLGEWQELTFDFTDVATGTFQSMIIYFERNAPCDGDIYYFDDIIQQ